MTCEALGLVGRLALFLLRGQQGVSPTSPGASFPALGHCLPACAGQFSVAYLRPLCNPLGLSVCRALPSVLKTQAVLVSPDPQLHLPHSGSRPVSAVAWTLSRCHELGFQGSPHRLPSSWESLSYTSMGFPDSSVGKESTCNAGDPGSIIWVRNICWFCWDRLPTPVFLGFPCGSAGKESAYNVGDLGLIPGSGRSPGEGNGNPLQYSCLESSVDKRAWWAIVHGVVRLRD